MYFEISKEIDRSNLKMSSLFVVLDDKALIILAHRMELKYHTFNSLLMDFINTAWGCLLHGNML